MTDDELFCHLMQQTQSIRRAIYNIEATIQLLRREDGKTVELPPAAPESPPCW